MVASAVLLLTIFSANSIAQQADLIFTGENIITMDASDVVAVAVRGDRIVASGSRAEVFELRGDDTRVIELGDRALLPGFIDAHGHFSSVSRSAALLDLSSPPVGGVTSIDDIVRALRLRIEQEQTPAGELVFGFGYDDSLLAEGRHPNRDDLDRASTNHPIVVRHVSGHLLAANSMALDQAGLSSSTQNPEGGIIRRRAGSNEPDGVMEETAMGAFPGSTGNMGPEMLSRLRREAIDIYAGYVITTIQDANIGIAYADLMRGEAEAGWRVAAATIRSKQHRGDSRRCLQLLLCIHGPAGCTGAGTGRLAHAHAAAARSAAASSHALADVRIVLADQRARAACPCPVDPFYILVSNLQSARSKRQRPAMEMSEQPSHNYNRKGKVKSPCC